MTPPDDPLSRRALLRGAVGGVAAVVAGARMPWAGASVVTSAMAARADAPTRTAAERADVQPDALFRVPTHRPLVALTFDDGPDPTYTPRVLDLLAGAGAQATFFVVGVNALAHPDLVARIRQEGHGIGNHTFDHRELELLSPEQVKHEVDRGARAIVRAGGAKPHLFRPPKGFTDEAVADLTVAEHYRTVYWDVCVERFVDHATLEAGTEGLLARIRRGSIVLAHDGGHIEAPGRPVIDRSRTLAALPLLLRGLADRGLRAVDVGTLMHHPRTRG